MAIENILARERAVKITSNQIKRLTAIGVDQMGLSADVALAVPIAGLQQSRGWNPRDRVLQRCRKDTFVSTLA